MISQIDPSRSAVASLLSAIIGTASEYVNFSMLTIGWISVDDALQRLAWTVAILAGLVAIVNGTRNWFKKVKAVKNEKKN